MNQKITEQAVDYRNFFYPPGGILLWIIILVEWITFGVALIVLAEKSLDDPALYHRSRLQLNVIYGTLNTLFLLTSGYFMAKSVQAGHKGDWIKASGYIRRAMWGGWAFVLLKSVEYMEKIHHGLVLGYNSFFDFYWLLTGFHLAHVLVGLGILYFMYRSMRKPGAQPDILNLEAGAAFWHMVDLIWILLFPMLYLIL